LAERIVTPNERRSPRAATPGRLVGMPFPHAITDEDGLRRVYRQPHPVVKRKAIDHVDDGARRFIAAAPFVVVSTAGPGGVDASPRGGPPGFVAVLDPGRLAIGDLSGNNRLDTFTNVVHDGRVGLLFMIPGVDETLRVNGRATLTDDPGVLDACPIDGTRPRVALGVDVDECFMHCAKAYRRSGLWKPESWLGPDEVPSAVEIMKAHVKLDHVPTEAVAADLEVGYAATMWKAGGEPPPADGQEAVPAEAQPAADPA
jgi:uncharacterized protein